MKTLDEICTAIAANAKASFEARQRVQEERGSEAYIRAYRQGERNEERYWRERDALRLEAYALVASEVLPRVLDGEWKFSGQGVSGPFGRVPQSTWLLDHPTSYVQRKAGRGGRRRYAYLGEPYPKADLPTAVSLVTFGNGEMVVIPIDGPSPWVAARGIGAFVVAEADLVKRAYRP